MEEGRRATELALKAQDEPDTPKKKALHYNTRCTHVRSPHGEVKLLLLPCFFLFTVDILQTCSLSCVSVLGFPGIGRYEQPAKVAG